MEMHMNNEEWQFVEGPWTEDEQGAIKAPGNLGDENLAIYTGGAYADLEAEWEFRWDDVWSNAGFFFRGRDPRHYYLVHFPVVGQHYRAEHFWGFVSKVGENGFVEVLNMEMVHGVTSTPAAWHKVRVVVAGNEIRVWVDGRPLRVVKDDTYAEPGYVGLSTYTTLQGADKSSFRNLRIRGQEAQAPPWNANVPPVRNWSPVSNAIGTACGNMVRTPNGDILLTTDEGLIVRSTDNARTWGDAERLPAGREGGWGMGRLHTTSDGLLAMVSLRFYDFKDLGHYDEKRQQEIRALLARGLPVKETETLEQLRDRALATRGVPPYEILRSVSEDNGKAWSDPVKTGEIVFGLDEPILELYTSSLLTLRDGTLLMFLWGRTGHELKHVEGRRYNIGPTPGFIQMCLRSTDDGQSWSQPADLDGRAGTHWMVTKDGRAATHWMVPKDHRSEISSAQTRDGKIITLTRPHDSPFMWESWSEDGGRTWTPTARGPFPMYASDNSMLTTSSGAILIGGRFPGLAVQVSYDDGMTWKCYRIDTACYANGAMLEVEPDVVFYAYGGKYLTKAVSKQTASELRGMFLRVTPEGVEPIRELPGE